MCYYCTGQLSHNGRLSGVKKGRKVTICPLYLEIFFNYVASPDHSKDEIGIPRSSARIKDKQKKKERKNACSTLRFNIMKSYIQTKQCKHDPCQKDLVKNLKGQHE